MLSEPFEGLGSLPSACGLRRAHAGCATSSTPAVVSHIVSSYANLSADLFLFILAAKTGFLSLFCERVYPSWGSPTSALNRKDNVAHDQGMPRTKRGGYAAELPTSALNRKNNVAHDQDMPSTKRGGYAA